jgi:hypothetical protein
VLIAPQSTRARGCSGISQNSAAFTQRFAGVYRCSAACCRHQRKLLLVSASLVLLLLLLLRQRLVTAPSCAGALRFGRHGQLRNRGDVSQGVVCEYQLLKVKRSSLSGFVMLPFVAVLLAATQSRALRRRR